MASQPQKDHGPCPICGRPLIPGKSVNEHHLVPKTYKGKATVLLHVVCHTKIHSLFSEYELFQYYHTIERICNHPEMQKFIRWLKNKDPEFLSRNKTSKEKGH